MKLFFCIFLSLLPICAYCDNADILPHAKNEKSAIEYDYFPSRLHAFVFRNWTSVSVERMAKVVGATPQQIKEIAEQMALPPQPKILPDWESANGYITVARRNWHMLNYSQLLVLLNIDAQTFKSRLLEDDFLFVKLGNLKPVCKELKYETPSDEV